MDLGDATTSINPVEVAEVVEFKLASRTLCNDTSISDITRPPGNL
jgi:hypothetical protein